jgi:hypothetical protein
MIAPARLAGRERLQSFSSEVDAGSREESASEE